MAESELTMEFADAQRTIALHLGWKLDLSDWTGNRETVGLEIIKAAERQFYVPPRVDPRKKAHRWAFLRPVETLPTVAPYDQDTETTTVTVSSGVVTFSGGTVPTWAADGLFLVDGNWYEVDTRDTTTQITLEDTSVDADAGSDFTLHRQWYQMPDLFASLDGPLVYSPGTTIFKDPLRNVSYNWIKERRQSIAWTETYPTHYAIVPKNLDPTEGQRWFITYFPFPDQAYTLYCRMKLAPNTIDGTNVYPVGGVEHSETFRASLKDKADEIARRLPNGPYHDMFLERLLASIDIDKQMGADQLGFDGGIADGESPTDWPYFQRVSADIAPEGHVLYEP